ncbi:MAG TPA: hypothetical protein PKY81_03120 [bacterium]|nr:hypothetical protein [bacterium]HPN29929.1 hypothetical protein [bacterium]
MIKKRKLIIIALLIFAIMTAATALFYKNAISPEIQLTVKDNELLKLKYGADYNQIIKSASDYFSKIFPSYLKNPYKPDDLNSKINEEYEIRSVELSKTSLENFGIRADITYDYSKTIIYKNDTEVIVKPNQTLILLQYKTNGKSNNDIVWKTATLSNWIILVLLLIFLGIFSVIYNFFFKTKTKKNLVKEETDSSE